MTRLCFIFRNPPALPLFQCTYFRPSISSKCSAATHCWFSSVLYQFIIALPALPFLFVDLPFGLVWLLHSLKLDDCFRLIVSSVVGAYLPVRSIKGEVSMGVQRNRQQSTLGPLIGGSLIGEVTGEGRYLLLKRLRESST